MATKRERLDELTHNQLDEIATAFGLTEHTHNLNKDDKVSYLESRLSVAELERVIGPEGGSIPGENATDEPARGTTSDASTRSADNRASEVPPDPYANVAKPSDAGPDLYPFPPQGDVDVATVDPGNGRGETFAPLLAEDWVILDGSHDAVPDEYDGRRAVVLNAPRYEFSEKDKKDYWVTVRTRDELNGTLTVPLTAVKEILRGGAAKHTAVRG